MTRRILLTITSAIALMTAAHAADIYHADGPGGYKDGSIMPVTTWTGFYIGANGGYGWTDYNTTAGTLQPEGGFGGGQIGYNWQGGFGLGHNVVFGIEADIQGGDITDKDSAAGTESNLNWFGTVRGRLGYAFDRTLIYATGGFAYGEVENRLTGVGAFKTNRTETGYVVGGGIEYKINPAWSVKFEYQHIDLDRDNSADYALGYRDADDSEFHTFRVGVNYHMHQSYEPLK